MGEIRENVRFNLSRLIENTISQKDLAQKLGVSQSAVTNWIKGNNSPDIEMVAKICEVLNISVNELFSSPLQSKELKHDIPSELLDKYVGPNQPPKVIAAFGGGMSDNNLEEIDKLVMDLKDQLIRQIMACELTIPQLRQIQEFIKVMEKIY